MVLKPNFLALWVVLLLKANHKETKMIWNGQTIIIKDGQVLTGRKELSKQTGIPETTIEGILTAMEGGSGEGKGGGYGLIRQQKTTKYRVITILHWKNYQIGDNKPTTNGQQTDTNKNDNNDKNDKKNPIATEVALAFNFTDYLKEMEEDKGRHINVIGHYFEQKGLTFKSRAEAGSAIKRHLRPAIEVAKFTDQEIVKATNVAKKETDKWTVETIWKVLTR